MPTYDFLVDTYRTERLKTLSVWSQIPDAQMRFRPEPRARTPLEHMVHQCMSEDAWMKSMLGITVSRAVLPAQETRLAFLEHYAAVSEERLASLAGKSERWFEETASFSGMDSGPSVHALGTPSWTADRLRAFVGPTSVLDVRSDS